ncbi:MAG TPA: DUF1844 domain-containing protein [Terracidiphilus sp.]|nr:DUF1844 domain-containing protein [Terracidiphilus sp.]
MSDTPKFEVIDRRKFKAEEEKESASTSTPEPEQPKAEEQTGPRLVVPEGIAEVREESAEAAGGLSAEEGTELPPAPSAEESREQKSAYDASAQRMEDLVRAQNPGIGAQPPIGFEHLVQQLYMTALIQLGLMAQEGQRSRVDILGARQTVDLLGILAEKTKGNLTDAEDRTLQSALFEARMAFLELSNMITMQGIQPPQTVPPIKR